MDALGNATNVPIWNFVIVAAVIWLLLTLCAVLLVVSGAIYQAFLNRYENNVTGVNDEG